MLAKKQLEQKDYEEWSHQLYEARLVDLVHCMICMYMYMCIIVVYLEVTETLQWTE